MGGEQVRIYGDENLGYPVLVRDMTPKDARIYYESTWNDGIAIHMPRGRLDALKLRSEELQ